MLFLTYTQNKIQIQKKKKINDNKIKDWIFMKRDLSIAKTNINPDGESIEGTGISTYSVIRKKREVLGRNQTQRKRRRRRRSWTAWGRGNVWRWHHRMRRGCGGDELAFLRGKATKPLRHVKWEKKRGTKKNKGFMEVKPAARVWKHL